MLKLEHYRLKNTYSLEDVAKFLDIKAFSIKHMETGYKHASEDVIRLYCELFGITPNDIYDIPKPKKSTIPLYKAILKHKSPIGIDKDAGVIKINSEQNNKKYSFAMQAWSMENTPKILTGDMLYFKFDSRIIDGDVILFIYKEKPLIRIYKENKGRIALKPFNNKYKTYYFDDLSDIEVVGRLVEINSILRKGGNPWPNGR